MRVLLWGPEAPEIIAQLQEKCSDYSYLAVGNWGQLELALSTGTDEFSVVVLDVDEQPAAALQSVQKFCEQFSHCPLLLSSQSLEKGPIEQFQQADYDIAGFLQRPYQVEELLSHLGQLRTQLFADAPADMKKGGTESVDMDVTLNADIQQLTVAFNVMEGQKGDREEPEEAPVEPAREEPVAGGDETEELLLQGSPSDEVAVEQGGQQEGQQEELVAGGGVTEEFLLQDVPLEEVAEAKIKEEEGDLLLGITASEGIVPAEVLSEDGESAQGEISLSGIEVEEGLKIEGAEQNIKPVLEPIPAEAKEEEEEETVEEATVKVGEGIHPSLQQLAQDSDDIAQHHSDELLHLKANLEALREEREFLAKKLADQEGERNEWRFKYNRLQAELHEAKIEVIFLKKRYGKDVEELKYAIKLAQEKKEILQEKIKQLQRDLELARGRAAFDTRKIYEREKTLESQLELLKIDSENLLKSRDKIILELKRKIDTLEFDCETMAQREKKAQEDKFLLEDRLGRVTGVLRRTVGSLSEDLVVEDSGDPEDKLTGL